MRMSIFKLGYVWVAAMLAVLFLSSCEKDDVGAQKKYSIVSKDYTGDMLRVTSVVPLPDFWPFDIGADSLQFHMSSMEDRQVIFSYWIKYEKVEDMLAFTLYIPEDNLPKDGTYRVVEILEPDGKKHYRRYVCEFKDHTMVSVANSTYNYNLPVAVDTLPKGTETNPYLIGSVKDLCQFSTDLQADSEGKGYGYYFALLTDIDFTSYYNDKNRPQNQGWCGIGGEFSGKFDGRNHIISNFKYNSNGDDIGLFKKLSDGAVVSNLKMDYVDIANAGNNVGAVAGIVTGTVLLDSITVNGYINAGGYKVGGLVGASSGNLTISACVFASGSINCDDDICGGLVGSAGGNSIVISNSEVRALHVESDAEMVGGFIGMCSSTTCKIEDCYSSPTINGSKCVGGLIGQVSVGSCEIIDTRVDANLLDASNPGKNENSNECVGGLVGLSSSLTKIDGCTVFHSSDQQYDQDIIGSPAIDKVGGFVGASYVELYIDNSEVESPVNGKNYIGGFVGIAEGKIEIKNSKNSDNSKVNGISKVGGLIGELGCYNAYIYYCDQYSSVTASGDYCGGIVGFSHLATMDDLYVAPSVVTGTGKFVGGVAGYMTNLKLSNMSFSGTLQISGSAFVGGVAGYLGNSEINSSFMAQNKTFSPIVNSANKSAHSVGGVAGRAEKSTFKDVTVNCTVYGKDTVGGFAGSVDDCKFEGCTYSGGGVNGTGDFTGGIIGRVNSSGTTMSNLTNTANVSGANRTGGIIGEVVRNNVYKCNNKGTVSGGQDVGGIMGRISNTSDGEIEIKECENNGTVKSTKRCLGGICGYVESSKNGSNIVNFRLCFNNSLVEGISTSNEDKDGIGGVIGEGKYSIRAINCANRGTVKGTNAYHHIGGIAGYMGQNSMGYDNDLYFEQCYNSGTVEVTAESGSVFVGGIAGHLEDAATTDKYVYVVDCYNLGTVRANTGSGDNAGGMVGKASYYLTMKRCFSAGMVYSSGNGKNLSNGMAGTHADAEVLYGAHDNLYTQNGTGKDWWGSLFDASNKSKTSTYNGFDFDSDDPVWVLDESKNNGYPYLKNTPLP